MFSVFLRIFFHSFLSFLVNHLEKNISIIKEEREKIKGDERKKEEIQSMEIDSLQGYSGRK
jgi:hypothetical protein